MNFEKGAGPIGKYLLVPESEPKKFKDLKKFSSFNFCVIFTENFALTRAPIETYLVAHFNKHFQARPGDLDVK